MERTLQCVFKDQYIERLRKNINPDDYKAKEFPYDASQIKFLANIYKPVGLLEKLDPNDDLKSAIAIYEAYKDLTPLVASLPNLWVYLTHVDLFPYVQERWGGSTLAKSEENNILNHWFYNGLRTTFYNMWWYVHMTIDENRADKYEFTRILYSNKDFINWFGELSLIRHKEAALGIFEFLAENPDVSSVALGARGKYITQYFNTIGGTRQLAFYNRDFFKNELQKIKLELLKIKSKDE